MTREQQEAYTESTGRAQQVECGQCFDWAVKLGRAGSDMVVARQPRRNPEAFGRWEKDLRSMSTGCCSTRARSPCGKDILVDASRSFLYA